MVKRYILFGGLILLMIIVVGVLSVYIYIAWTASTRSPTELVLIVVDEDDMGVAPVLNITLMDLTDYPTLQEAINQMLALEPLTPGTWVALHIQQEESHLMYTQLLICEEAICEEVGWYFYHFVAYQQYFFEIGILS